MYLEKTRKDKMTNNWEWRPEVFLSRYTRLIQPLVVPTFFFGHHRT